MKKKLLVLLTTTTVTMLAAAAVILFPNRESEFARGDLEYHIVLDSNTEIEELDYGYLHQANVKENKIDFINLTNDGGDIGSIYRKQCGDFVYNGIVYNRSVINGFKSLTVEYSGANLHYVFTDFLMEDMNFNSTGILISGVPVAVPAGKAYFMVYNDTEDYADIDKIDISYSCDGNIDNTMIFNKNSQMGNARSASRDTILEDSFVQLENNPLDNNNNYSTGSYGGHPAAWYRWNGRYFANSDELGTDFRFGLTIMGDFSRVTDTSKNFHYAVWPQFNYAGSQDRGENLNETYAQTYIGSDNYEPLGKDNALHPSDPYVQEAYIGRFFTDYGWYDNQWKFADPDTTLIEGGTYTFREAYEAYNMPYWFIEFHVFMGEDQPECDIYINGFKVINQEIFEHYDMASKPSIFIKTMPMHIVNYGITADGVPDSSYLGRFTYPRLINN